MDFSEQALVALIQQFVKDEKGDMRSTVTGETELLRGGLLDSFNLVALTQRISESFARPIPRGSLVPEDFATPAVLCARLAEVWSE